MRYYCTYFDHRYLTRGLALYHSLRKHSDSFQLWVLCMDEPCYELLSQLGLPGIRPVSLATFESGDVELLKSKQNRRLLEYYFTCTPSLPLFILKTSPEVNVITYLDADLFFFRDPQPIHAEIGDASIAIIEHRFPPHLSHLTQFGIYNVAWLSFRRDSHALACLQWWRERCLEYCQDGAQDGRFADQKYLDDWPTRFQKVVVLQHKGANLAPWNLANYRVRLDGEDVFVDQEPLVFFHFHGFKRVQRWIYDLNLAPYDVIPSKIVLRSIYQPYLRMLHKLSEQLPSHPTRSSLARGARAGVAQSQVPCRLSLSRRVLTGIAELAHSARGVQTHRYVLAVNGTIIV